MNPRWIFYGSHRIQEAYLGSRLIFRSQVRRPGIAYETEELQFDAELLTAIAKAFGIVCEEITVSCAVAQSLESDPAKVREALGVKDDAHLRVGKVLLSDTEKTRMQVEAKPEALASAALKTNGAGVVNATGLAEAAHLKAQKLLREAILPMEAGFVAEANADTARAGKATVEAQTTHKGKAYAQKLLKPASGIGKTGSAAKGRSEAGKPVAAELSALTKHNGKLYGQKLLRPVSGTARERATGKIVAGPAKPGNASGMGKLSNRVEVRSDAAEAVAGNATVKLTAMARPRAQPPETAKAAGVARSRANAKPDVLNESTGTLAGMVVSGELAALLAGRTVPLAAMMGVNARYAVTMDKQSAATVWIDPVQTGKKLKIVSVYECSQEGRKLIIR